MNVPFNLLGFSTNKGQVKTYCSTIPPLDTMEHNISKEQADGVQIRTLMRWSEGWFSPSVILWGKITRMVSHCVELLTQSPERQVSCRFFNKGGKASKSRYRNSIFACERKRETTTEVKINAVSMKIIALASYICWGRLWSRFLPPLWASADHTYDSMGGYYPA